MKTYFLILNPTLPLIKQIFYLNVLLYLQNQLNINVLNWRGQLFSGFIPLMQIEFLLLPSLRAENLVSLFQVPSFNMWSSSVTSDLTQGGSDARHSGDTLLWNMEDWRKVGLRRARLWASDLTLMGWFHWKRPFRPSGSYRILMDPTVPILCYYRMW